MAVQRSAALSELAVDLGADLGPGAIAALVRHELRGRHRNRRSRHPSPAGDLSPHLPPRYPGGPGAGAQRGGQHVHPPCRIGPRHALRLAHRADPRAGQVCPPLDLRPHHQLLAGAGVPGLRAPGLARRRPDRRLFPGKRAGSDADLGQPARLAPGKPDDHAPGEVLPHGAIQPGAGRAADDRLLSFAAGPLCRGGDLSTVAGVPGHAGRGRPALRCRPDRAGRPACRFQRDCPGDGAGQPLLAAGKLAGAPAYPAPRPGVGRRLCSSSSIGPARSARRSAPSSSRRLPTCWSSTMSAYASRGPAGCCSAA